MIETIKSYTLCALALIIVIGYYLLDIKIKQVSAERDQFAAKIQTLTTMINTQNNAVLEWKQNSLIAERRLRNAEVRAHKDIKTMQKISSKTMIESVPNDCVKAKDWAIKKATEIKND